MPRAFKQSTLSRWRKARIERGHTIDVVTRLGPALRIACVLIFVLGSCPISCLTSLLVELVLDIPDSILPWFFPSVSISFFLLGLWLNRLSERQHTAFLSPRLRTLAGRPYFCHACGYDLRCSCAKTCPECGWEIDIKQKQPRERWRVIRGKRILRGLRYVSVILCTGTILLVVWAIFRLNSQ